jgi:hypothetical protein
MPALTEISASDTSTHEQQKKRRSEIEISLKNDIDGDRAHCTSKLIIKHYNVTCSAAVQPLGSENVLA